MTMQTQHKARSPMADLSFDEAVESFETTTYYRTFAEVLIKCLCLSSSYDELKEVWALNLNMIDGAKKLVPDVYNEIRTAFANRRAELEKDSG